MFVRVKALVVVGIWAGLAGCASAEAQAAGGRCPALGFRPPAEAFIAVPSGLEQSAALRSEFQIATPAGSPMVVVQSEAGHYTVFRSSFVATRSVAGRWAVDAVIHERGQLMPMEPKLEHLNWTLSTADGATLDRLIADPCLYAEAPNLSDPAGGQRGSSTVLTDVVTADRTRAARQYAGPFGLTGQISQIVTAGLDAARAAASMP